MKRKFSFFFLFFFSLLFVSCGGEEQISHDYLCRFTLDKQLHLTSKIITAVNSQGYFVWIEMSRQGQVMHVKVHPADGSGDEDIALTTAEENYISYELGAYNGIILGCRRFDGPVAYDRQCPNCLQNTGLFVAPLTWSSKFMEVKCTRCGRTYSLDTGDCLQEGKRLMQYAVFNGANRVMVTN